VSQGNEEPRTGDLRFTAAGDVEVFDGDRWCPVASLLGEAGMREDPPEPGPESGVELGAGDPPE
jgi:hypothetical protein